MRCWNCGYSRVYRNEEGPMELMIYCCRHIPLSSYGPDYDDLTSDMETDFYKVCDRYYPHDDEVYITRLTDIMRSTGIYRDDPNQRW